MRCGGCKGCSSDADWKSMVVGRCSVQSPTPAGTGDSAIHNAHDICGSGFFRLACVALIIARHAQFALDDSPRWTSVWAFPLEFGFVI
jgi:hypothetical protein